MTPTKTAGNHWAAKQRNTLIKLVGLLGLEPRTKGL